MPTARVSNESLSSRTAVRLPFPVRWLLRRPRDSMAGACAVIGAGAILINALFMQKGPHPAPIFANKPVPVTTPLMGSVTALMPKGGAPASSGTSNAPVRSETIADIQRALWKRGFYGGAADGVYGAKTDSAIRDFEQTAGLRPSAEPNDVLLTAINRSSVKAPARPAPSTDPIAALLAPSPRIVAVQRALTDFGYGPVKPTGVHDAETRLAVERFEKARRRPATGQITDQLVHDLATLTGRPLE